MNKELKDKWIAALRSGEYEQGRGSLYHPPSDKYCCLGVLARIVDPTSINHYGGGVFTAADEASISNVYLPTSVYMAAGLQGDMQIKLTVMNDSGRKSFTEIADWIEENIDASE